MTEPRSIARGNYYADQYHSQVNPQQGVQSPYEEGLDIEEGSFDSSEDSTEYLGADDPGRSAAAEDGGLLRDLEDGDVAMEGEASPIEWGQEPAPDPLALKREIRSLIGSKESNEFVLEQAQRDGFTARLNRIFSGPGTAEEKLDAVLELKDEVQGALQEAEAQRVEWPNMFAHETQGVRAQLGRLETADVIDSEQKTEWEERSQGIEQRLQRGQITLSQARDQLKALSEDINAELREQHESDGGEREAAIQEFQRALDGLGATPDAGYSGELGRARDGGEFIGTLLVNIATGFMPAMMELGKIGTNRGPDPVRTREFANALKTALLQEGDDPSPASSRPIDPNDPSTLPNDRWSAVERLFSGYGSDKFQYATMLVMAVRNIAGSDAEAKRLLNVLPVDLRNALVTALNSSGKFLNDGHFTQGLTPAQASSLVSESLNDEEHRYYSQAQRGEAPQITYNPGQDPVENPDV
ncbi:MAG TPA: hypothetical protein VJP40_05350 [bacterium]|nr:hypothetical protein [bacterium]